MYACMLYTLSWSDSISWICSPAKDPCLEQCSPAGDPDKCKKCGQVCDDGGDKEKCEACIKNTGCEDCAKCQKDNDGGDDDDDRDQKAVKLHDTSH